MIFSPPSRSSLTCRPMFSPWYSLLLPLIVEPYTNGYEWARRPGCENGHLGIEHGEELTDEDDVEQ